LSAPAKKHHYVPQFYLRKFAEDEQIATVRLPGDRRYVSSVIDTGSENRFHTVRQNPANPEILEEAFGELEDDAAPIIQRVEDGLWPLPREERMTLAGFVVFQALRGPDQRRLMKNLQTRMMERETRAVAERGASRWFEDRRLHVDGDAAKEAWDRTASAEEPPVVIDALYHAGRIASLAERVMPHFIGRRWKLVRFDYPSLVTSDAPVSLDDVSDGEQGRYGLMTARTISYPLSRTRALLFGDTVPVRARVELAAVRSGKFDSQVRGTADDQRYVNGRTVHNAARALFHHPADAAYIPVELPNPRD
jgi:hypothetical protein